VTAIALRDPRDEALPAAGWVEFEDLESGKRTLVNTSNPKVRAAYVREAQEHRLAAERVLEQARCPLVTLHVERPWMPVLMRYFASRRRGRAGTAA
jgi:uncharacterized protein (DUF58 family)